MFTFVNFAMTCATNRYLSFELGKNNIENVNKVLRNGYKGKGCRLERYIV